MNDLISRQAAIEIIDGYMNRLAKHIGTMTDNERYAYARGTLLGVEAGINALPSSQSEIIRCEDCRWGEEVCGNIECFVDGNILSEYHGYNWFCPNGERRTENG